MNHKKDDDGDLLSQLEACERRVWNALVRGDVEADQDALDDTFLGVYSDGFAGKHEHVRQLADGPTIANYTLSNLRAIRLGHQHAVLSYRADFLRAAQTTFEAMYVSSIWKHARKGWVNIFSQDTPAIH